MKKKNSISKITIFLSVIFIAFIINLLFTHGANQIESCFSIVIGILAIIYSNINCKKTIDQQNNILNLQHKEKLLDEYNKCLRNNLELMNAVDVIGITVAIDHDHLSTSKAEIVKKKSLIFSYDLQYRYVFEVDSNTNKTDIEERYNNCWIESHSLLSNLLDVQMNFIVRISQNKAETNIKLNNQGVISALQRLIELSNNKNDIAIYQERVSETHKELELLETSIRTYKNDVDAMTTEIKHLMDMLLVKTKELFDLSILLMKEKENLPADKFF